MKKIVYLVCFTILAVTVSGCSLIGKSKEDSKKEKTRQTKVTESKNTDKVKEMPLIKNKELTNQIKKENGLYGGQVYVQNNYAIATMVVKKGVKRDRIKSLVNEYSEKLKNEYKGKNINIQAVQNGKNMENKTILNDKKK